MKKQPLGEILIQKKLITEEQVEEALRAQVTGSRRIGYVLIKMGLLTENQLFEALSDQNNIPKIDIEKEFDGKARKLLPRYLCRKYGAVPVCFEKNNVLKLAMVNPLDEEAIDDIDHYTKMLVKPCLAHENEIYAAIKEHIPFQMKDLLSTQVYSKTARNVSILSLVLLLVINFFIYRDMYRKRYGSVTVSENTVVYSNLGMMIGVEGEGAISLIGHGPYAKGFYSVVFNDPAALKAFVLEKKDNLTAKQFEWILRVVDNRLTNTK